MTLLSKPQRGFLDTLPADLAAFDWAGAVDLTGIEPIPLTEEGRYDFEASGFYRLDDLIPGETVVVEMTSDEIDTYPYLIDTTASLYIGADDDSPDTSRSKITFTAQRGVSYWIEATSFSGLDTGTNSVSRWCQGGWTPSQARSRCQGLPATPIHSTSPNSCPRPSRCSAATSVINQSYTVTDELMATRPTRAAW